MALLGSLYQLQ